MKNILLSTLLIVITGILSSVQYAIDVNDLIGTWKVKTITKNDGTHKKGDKLMTMNSDNTYVSEDTKSHKSQSGKWLYDSALGQLRFKDFDADEWAVMDLVKVTNRKLILKTEEKVFKSVKVN